MGGWRARLAAAAVLAASLATTGCADGTGAPDRTAAVAEGARTLDGYLLYREPLILPRDALAEVSLVRLAADGSVADVVAVDAVDGPLLPPIPFRLIYDPDYLRAGSGDTALTATIELYGRTLFSSDRPLPVALPVPVDRQPLVVPVFGQWGYVDARF